ncbi:MAG: hypothetical protein WA431_08775 [Candidatus Cybelea sp.]
MFQNGSILRTASGLAAAVLLAQLLAGCTGATQALPGGSVAQSQAAAFHAPLTSQQKDTMKPSMCNGCNTCPPGYQYGTFWQEYTDTSPPTWAEFTGDYIYEDFNGKWEDVACGTWVEDQVCNPASYANCPPTNPWWANEAVVSWESQEADFAVSVPLSHSVSVVQTLSAKKGYNVLSTLTTGDATPVGVAADSSGTIYASVFAEGTSGMQPYVDVYSKGATSPSSELTDSAAAGDSPAGVAVDKRRDVFWALDSAYGSSQTIQIVEFPEGANKPIPFASIPGSGGGAVAATTKGEIVATSPSEGMVYVFASNGKALGKFTASGSPASISLDRKDQHLYVADGTNNAISDYAFPSGKLISSAPVEVKGGNAIMPASALPKNPQLP